VRECKNCNYALAEDDNYCAACGAKWVQNRFTPRYLASEFSDRYLGTDNVLLRTLVHLLRRPDAVVIGYLSGVRKRYVNVINFLTITLTVLGVEFVIIKRFFIRDMTAMYDDAAFESSGQQQLMQSWSEFSLEYQSFFILGSIPLLALLSYLTFKTHSQKLNFTEHTVVVTYFVCTYSLISAVTTLTVLALIPEYFIYYTSVIVVISLGYGIFYYYRLYRLEASGVVLRTLLFYGLLIALYIITVLLGIFIVLTAIKMDIIDPELLKDFLPKK